jgi:virginiamycin A acetyltransferase
MASIVPVRDAILSASEKIGKHGMADSLEEKEHEFLNGTLCPTVELDPKEHAKAEISGKVDLLKNAFFERSTSMGSEIIAARGSVFLGAHSYMNNFGYIRSNTFIGRFCSIGRRVTIGAGAHYMTGLSTSPSLSSGAAGVNYDEGELRELSFSPDKITGRHSVIKSDVWIGDGAIVMPGVVIGTGSVIGANSVVTKDVEPYTVVAGVPAKAIRRRFPSEICEALLASYWWEIPISCLKKMDPGNIQVFLKHAGGAGSPATEKSCLETYALRDDKLKG